MVSERLHFPGPHVLAHLAEKSLKKLATLQKKHASHNLKNFLNVYKHNQTQAFIHP